MPGYLYRDDLLGWSRWLKKGGTRVSSDCGGAETARDQRRALGFVRRHVRRLYGGIPPPSQIFLFAERKRRICGTIALDFSDGLEMFPPREHLFILTTR